MGYRTKKLNFVLWYGTTWSTTGSGTISSSKAGCTTKPLNRSVDLCSTEKLVNVLSAVSGTSMKSWKHRLSFPLVRKLVRSEIGDGSLDPWWKTCATCGFWSFPGVFQVITRDQRLGPFLSFSSNDRKLNGLLVESALSSMTFPASSRPHTIF